jgi:hypothetical protein
MRQKEAGKQALLHLHGNWKCVHYMLMSASSANHKTQMLSVSWHTCLTKIAIIYVWHNPLVEKTTVKILEIQKFDYIVR